MKKGNRTKKGFTLVEITLVISLLLALVLATMGGINGYQNYKNGAQAGQKLRGVLNIIRLANAQRLPVDAMLPTFGTGATEIEKIHIGNAVTGINPATANPNDAATIVTYLEGYHASNSNYTLLMPLYANSSGGSASNELFYHRDYATNRIRYMRIRAGVPFFTTKGSTQKFDPSNSTTDMLWDAGY